MSSMLAAAGRLLTWWAGITAVMFAHDWVGVDNGPTPRFWGGPITLRDALSHLPKEAIISAIVVLVARRVILGTDQDDGPTTLQLSKPTDDD